VYAASARKRHCASGRGPLAPAPPYPLGWSLTWPLSRKSLTPAVHRTRIPRSPARSLGHLGNHALASACNPLSTST
jgi:hypothetical protein